MLETPALILDLDALDANIASMAEHARIHGYALRPVAKIHKSVDIARRQIAAGAIGICCATLAEAEAMAEAGIPGVMLFSTIVSPAKLKRLAALNARAEGLLVVTDSSANVAQLDQAATESGRTLNVLVDIEVGGRRTGIGDEQRALEVVDAVLRSGHLHYAGLQGYVGDHQAITDYQQRRGESHTLLQPLVRIVERLEADGRKPGVVSGGGTGTHDFDHELGILTELQAGTYVFMDMFYKDVILRRELPHPFRPALTVRTTVISAAQPHFVVTDAGLKEVDAVLGLENPLIVSGAPEGSRYVLVGDDLGRIELPGGRDTLAVGSSLEVMPPHCYQTVVLHPYYHVVRGDELVDIWPISARANV
jgi:D-serine deaminase-like pyridoxal phosphate-dependent protein